MPGIDDFAFIGRDGTLLAALNKPNTVELVQPDGSHRVVLDESDGLQNPSAVAVRGDVVSVVSAAYFTQTDPNLLQARLTR